MSDDDHVEVDIVVEHVDGVNNNNKKIKFSLKSKKAHGVEDVKGVNDKKVPLNKKSNEIVTRKNVQLVAQDYSQIKWA